MEKYVHKLSQIHLLIASEMDPYYTYNRKEHLYPQIAAMSKILVSLIAERKDRELRAEIVKMKREES